VVVQVVFPRRTRGIQRRAIPEYLRGMAAEQAAALSYKTPTSEQQILNKSKIVRGDSQVVVKFNQIRFF
jgi:hypothetical protein